MPKRGPYKTYLGQSNCKVPRQTKSYRRRMMLDASSGNKGQERDSSADTDSEFISLSMDSEVDDDDDTSKEISSANCDNGFQNLVEPVPEQSVVVDDGKEDCEWDQDFEDEDDDEYFGDDSTFFDESSVQGVVEEDNLNASDSLLYEGAPITVGASLLLIITFALTHNLTGQALADLLSLIACHCLSPNFCSMSLRTFKKHFRNLRSPLLCHYYCSFCFGAREKNILLCRECGLTMTKEQAEKSFFIESPVSEQLQTLFSRKGFYGLLSYPENRKKKKEENIEDILDGSEYRRLKKKGRFLSYKNHFSFSVNTDGVALFRSSAFSIWPIYLQINELPPHLRTTPSNVIFAGLWFGEAKPYMHTFLQPLKSSLVNLQSQGLKVSIDEQEEIDVKFMLLCSSFDLPAKCMVQDFQQFNGFYGCSVCEKPGNTCPTSSRGHTHVYLMTLEEYNSPSGHPPLRTRESTARYAKEAIRHRKPVKGVKGFSVLHDLKGFDIIRGVAVDYMHCVLLGVVKMLLHLWFDISQKGQPYFCGDNLEQIEERLLSIKPTMYISRTPRSIGKHRKYWKASELRAWLIFYSAPVMSGILPRKYLRHFMCLVRGVYLLLKDSISKEDLAEAAQLLSLFVFYMDVLYGERYCTANVHYLLHLTESVIWQGPLWATSCFSFENLNGVAKKLFHGTQHVAEQILSAVSIIQGIPTLKTKIPNDSPVDVLCKKMTHQLGSRECRYEFAPGCFAIGVMTRREFGKAIHEDAAITNALQGQAGTCEMFSRCEVNKKTIHSQNYKRVTKRNTFTICYADMNQEKCYGQVLYYIKNTPICNNTCLHLCNFHLPTYWALIYKLPFSEVNPLKFKVQDDGFPIAINSSQICVLKKPLSHVLHVLPISDILDVVTCVEFEDDDSENVLYVCHSPNTIEKD